MAQWIETKLRYDKIAENGSLKKVTEVFMVDALSFTEAEARITEERTPYVSGDFTVSAVTKSNIAEVFPSEGADRWYKVKAEFISIDEKTACEKRSANYFLVQAVDFRNALENFIVAMKGTMADFEIVGINETKILDIYNAKLG